MAVVFTRVDDRLIHGQIVQGWLPGLSVDELVLVIDGADCLMSSLARMALPLEYGLKILSVPDAVDYIKTADTKIFLLFSNLPDATAALELGLEIKNINIGGMHYRDGRKMVLKDVYLDAAEIDAVKNLCKRGISVDGRSVPKESHANLENILCK